MADDSTPDDWVPRRVDAAPMTGTQLSPAEAFVYSRVDGLLTVRILADVFGYRIDDLVAHVTRLHSLGLVEFVEPTEEPQDTHPIVEVDLGERVDLDEQTRLDILALHGKLDAVDHYELLGVEPTADRNAIRSAYFSLSKRFHPDAQFRRQLGSYQSKLEEIFSRLTIAHDTLAKESKRAEYDAYLTLKRRTSMHERELHRGAARAEAVARAVLEQAREPEASGSERPRVDSQSPSPTIDDEVRRRRKRELLERKLQGSSRRPSDRSARPPAPSPNGGRSSVLPAEAQREVLRGLTASLKGMANMRGASTEAVDRYMRLAASSEREGDLVRATGSLRIALGMDPANAAARRELERVTWIFERDLRDAHVTQARYEESEGNWGAASLTWSKIVSSFPDDPVALRQGASAMVKARGDLRSARAYLLRSIEIEPNVAEAHCMLAHVYLNAGMIASAKKSLETANKLDAPPTMLQQLTDAIAAGSQRTTE